MTWKWDWFLFGKVAPAHMQPQNNWNKLAIRARAGLVWVAVNKTSELGFITPFFSCCFKSAQCVQLRFRLEKTWVHCSRNTVMNSELTRKIKIRIEVYILFTNINLVAIMQMQNAAKNNIWRKFKFFPIFSIMLLFII